MNPYTKEFEPLPANEPIPEEKRDWTQFAVGEEHEINGVKFRVRKITKKDVVLRPVT